VSEKRRKREKRLTRKKAARLGAPALVERDAAGRTHLVVTRDAAGRVARLALSRPLFDDAWQNELAVAAASTTHGLLSRGETLENAVELARNAMAATSKIAEGMLARETEQKLACHDGCAHCCYQAVGVSAPEALAIYAHLQRTRSPEELDATLLRVRETDDRTRGMPPAQRLSPDLPCPFLEQERCSIYEVRPLACRGKNSLDAAACERTLRDPEARAELLAGKLGVPCFLEPIRTFHAVAAGVQLALSELHGLGAEPLELTAAVRLIADDAEAVARAYLAGEDPFAAARGGDNSGDDRIRDLSGRRNA
jgi:hypothetical protein